MNEELTYQKVLQMFAETDRRMEAKMEAMRVEIREAERKREKLELKWSKQREEDNRQRDEEDKQRERDYSKRREEDRSKTEAAIRKLSKEVSRLRDLFESQWSRLLEALVDGKLVHLLRQRQIPVNHTSSNVAGVSADGQAYEFDILAVNGDAVVVVEVKSRLQSDDVREFVNELKHFKSWLREYQGMKVYGAIAYLRADESAIRQAQNQGMFVIKAVGDSAQIINPPDFQARAW